MDNHDGFPLSLCFCKTRIKKKYIAGYYSHDLIVTVVRNNNYSCLPKTVLATECKETDQFIAINTDQVTVWSQCPASGTRTPIRLPVSVICAVSTFFY